MTSLKQFLKKWGAADWAVMVVFPLIVGIFLSLLIQQPILGVIHFSDEIYGNSANELITQFRYAYDHPEIRAVVIVIDSPGGTVTDTEAIYMELSRLRTKKPVVMMVQGMAASGAYYLSSASSYIIAEPSALVGNVGVIRSMPAQPSITEDTYSTGPYKLWGGPGDTFIREMELMKQGFLQAIQIGRGNRLSISEELILRGQIWPGSEALKYGLIDELGSQSIAYDKAAQLSHITNYSIKDLRDLSGLPEASIYPFYYNAPDGTFIKTPREPGFYFLYIPIFNEVKP
jgi:protease IV